MKSLAGSMLAAPILLSLSLAPARAADVEGSRDHPAIKRYEGCEILHFRHAKYGDFELPLGPMVDDVIEPRRKVEGEKTEIFYVCPAGRSSLEVFRNFRTELAALGYSVLYEGSGAELGPYYQFAATVFPTNFEIRNVNPFDRNQAGQRYLAAERPASATGAASHVALYVTEDNEHNDRLGTVKGQPIMKLVVIDGASMEARMVVVSSEEMASEIGASGSVALYGILFDTAKATLKPDSTDALVQIAALLANDPKLSLLVVGHTDNAGTFAANQALSLQRAQAVTSALVSQYRVAAHRLTPVGVSSAAPVATNRTEEGRAKNRRVQLVER